MALVGLSTLATLGLRSDLEAGARGLRKGRQAVSYGNLEGARAAFSQAEESFNDAASAAGGGPAGMVGALPILGRNVDVARGVALAGRELAESGTELVDAVDTLPEGLASLAPTDGILPVDALAGLGDEVGSAATKAHRAQALIRATPSTMLTGWVAEARLSVIDDVGRAAQALDAASQLLDGLPSFAGAEGPRQYFFVAESPAEARGTGGIWGAWAILTVEDGRFSFSEFQPIQRLPDLQPDEVPAPNPDYHRNYDQYGGAGFWRNMNLTPDFPSAARAVLAAYEVVNGEQLDGVISADPFVLAELLDVTGPTEVPGLGVKLDAGNVVDFMTNDAYVRFPGESVERKGLLGAVAGQVFDRFLGMDRHGIGRIRALARSVADGHLKIYTTDPTLQGGLALAHADGAFTAPPGDMVAVVVNSRSGSKVDYYAHRTVDYDVILGGEGEAFGTTSVAIRNDAPDHGLPGFVIDPLAEGEPGDNIALVTVSCPDPCDLVEAQRNGEDRAMRIGSELGFPWYQDFFTIPSGETGTLRLLTKRQGVWEGNSSGGQLPAHGAHPDHRAAHRRLRSRSTRPRARGSPGRARRWRSTVEPPCGAGRRAPGSSSRSGSRRRCRCGGGATPAGESPSSSALVSASGAGLTRAGAHASRSSARRVRPVARPRTCESAPGIPRRSARVRRSQAACAARRRATNRATSPTTTRIAATTSGVETLPPVKAVPPPLPLTTVVGAGGVRVVRKRGTRQRENHDDGPHEDSGHPLHAGGSLLSPVRPPIGGLTTVPMIGRSGYS